MQITSAEEKELTMRKDTYEKPDIVWLKEKFKDLKLGWLKASEMEVYLAYMLMYEDDFEKSVYDIAEEYGYTESKVRKLQVEFAKRFVDCSKMENDDAFLCRVFSSMLSEDELSRIKLDIKPSAITFTIYNPADARRFRKIIMQKGVMSYSDFSKDVFHLSPIVFAILFRGCNKDFDSRLNDALLKSKTTKMNLRNLFPTRLEKTSRRVKELGAHVTDAVMSSAVAVAVGSLQ